MVKITSFEAENVKRIKAVQFTPSEDGLTIIGGKNANGKTSVLDSIVYALGGEKYRPKNFNRDGSAVPGKIRIELSNGLIVERSGKNATLKVTDPTGRKAGQKLLNEFIEPLALNLPEFLNASDKEKGETLLQIIGVGEELSELDKQENLIYSERTLVGRDADKKAKLAEALEYYPDAPEELVSASELIKQQQEILAKNGRNEEFRQKASDLEKKEALAWEKVTLAQAELEKAQARLEELKKEFNEVSEAKEAAFFDASKLEDESTAEIEENIANIEEINRRVRANLTKANAVDEAEQLQNEYKKLTGDLEAVREQRKALLDSADLPLEGLSVNEGALVYKGQQWSDMSSAEQLIVATAIVRKLNPECGFVLMDKLEQMDTDTLAEFGSWLETEGLQVIATRVSTGEECSIIIEDGTVVESQVKEEKPKFVQRAWTPGEF